MRPVPIYLSDHHKMSGLEFCRVVSDQRSQLKASGGLAVSEGHAIV